MPKQDFIERVVVFLTLLVGIAPLIAIADEGSPAAVKTDLPATALQPGFTTIVVTKGGHGPHLQVAPDGMLLALGYNSPAHTTLPADVDCWASDDGGRSWNKRGTAAPRPNAEANYCHWASGFTTKNELLVVVSGMDDAANKLGMRRPNAVRVFRSADFGKTWMMSGAFPAELPGGLKPYPFGSIVRGGDSSLRTLVYPSTAQLPDGKLVTVFYAQKSPLHDGYHMGAIGWQTTQWPKVGGVERQPLLPQVLRLQEAMEQIGSPLSEDLRVRLRIGSPNSHPLPHAPANEVASTCLGLSMLEGQPLTASLSGLPLEYPPQSKRLAPDFFLSTADLSHNRRDRATSR